MQEDLIHRCKKEDRLAQKEIYEKLFGKMFAVCIRYTRNEEDAIEVCNSGFLKVFTSIDQYKFKGSFEGWVRQIIVRTAIDFLRSSKTYKKQTVFNLQATDVSVDNPALDNLKVEDLYKLIGQLPETSRMVFNLYVIEGYPHKDIAEKLGISVGTSKWHLSFARQELRKKIKKKQENLADKYDEQVRSKIG